MKRFITIVAVAVALALAGHAHAQTFNLFKPASGIL